MSDCPPQYELAERYDVARETVKEALRILRDERLIVTRQGSGAYVWSRTERPVGLRPHLEAAYERAQVSIDFAGFSGETIHGALQEPLDKVRIGRLAPETIAIRVLLPDMTIPGVVPALANARDDESVRARSANIARRHMDAIKDSVHELADLGLVREATVEVRAHRGSAPMKLYILNRKEVFFGFYPIVKHNVRVNGRSVAILDVMGKDSTLFHFTVSDGDEGIGAPFAEQAQQWFDSVWNTISYEYPS